MAKNKFLDLTGLSTFKDKIIEKITNHTSDNNVHISSEEKANLSNSYSHSQSEHAPTDAEKNVIVGVQKNGTDLEINETTRKVDIVIPTKLSEFENDLGLSGDGESITVDTELSETSENPVQNKVIKENLDSKLDKQNPNATGSLSLNRQSGTTIGEKSIAIGDRTTATGKAALAEGCLTEATGSQSHAEGDGTKATAIGAHSEGGYATDNAGVKYFTTSSNSYAHAEGAGTTASGVASHSEGSLTQATGKGSHSEGVNTTASSESAHSEGANSIASGTASHAEGYDTEASGYGSHSEGCETKAQGNYSHTEGSGTIAQWHNQHVQGRYNEELTEEVAKTLAHVVGGGTYNNGNPIRKNIHTLDWNGNATFAGDIVATKEDGTEVSLVEISGMSDNVAYIDATDNENVTDAAVAEGSSHTHDNKDVLDKLSESADGNLLFNGKEIQGGSSGNENIDFEDEDIDFSTDY